MFAVIRTGGKQYKVAKNDVIRVERLPGATGDLVELNEVLMLGEGDQVTVGAPLVAGACVGAALLGQGQSDKVLIFKKNRRHNYRRKNGHRQHLTVLRITEILTDGQKPNKELAAAAVKPAKAEAPAKPTAKKAAKPKAPARKAEAAGKKPAVKKAAKAKSAAPKAAKPKAAPKAKKKSEE